MIEVQPLTSVQSQLGEGPIWYDETLFWVDIVGQYIHSYDPATEALRSIQMPYMVGTVVPRQRGGLVAALQPGFFFIDDSGQWSPAVPDVVPADDIRFNDGKCDPAGRLWAGTMALDARPGMGSLYRLDTDLSVEEKISGVTISNGICWSLDNQSMYYIDTPTQQVVMYDYDMDTGNIANPRPVIEIDKRDGSPDGMTIDAEGNLWIALWGGSAVVCHDPRTGERLARIQLPCEQVTACAFGGPDLDTLYITTARQGYDSAKSQAQPKAGRLFVCNPGVKGTPAFSFAG